MMLANINKTLVDVIGDIHGYSDKLEQLLLKLGYQEINGVYQHSERIAVFIGDLIDRGPNQLKVLSIVRSMVSENKAICLLGNHEFNAIGYAIKNKEGTDYLRKHVPKNVKQSQSFLNEVIEGSLLHKDIISWFLTLPIWVETDTRNFVHACWKQEYVDILSKNANYLDTSNIEDYYCFSDNGNNALSSRTQAIEVLLKGPEIDLPENISYVDPDGVTRKKTRLLWWKYSDNFYDMADLSSEKLSETFKEYKVDNLWANKEYIKRTYIGHYWMKGSPDKLDNNVICVDWSVAKKGYLVAWRETDLVGNGFFVSI